MKPMMLLFLMAPFFSTFGQNIVTPEGDFMDSSSLVNPKCIFPYQASYGPIYYYSCGAKYPKNSETLLKETQLFLRRKNMEAVGSGYITFRFMIDCEGKMANKVQVLQTNEQYKTIHFDKGFVNGLYAFLLTLDKWKIVKTNYMAFITFKIKNGKVINIIP